MLDCFPSAADTLYQSIQCVRGEVVEQNQVSATESQVRLLEIKISRFNPKIAAVKLPRRLRWMVTKWSETTNSGAVSSLETKAILWFCFLFSWVAKFWVSKAPLIVPFVTKPPLPLQTHVRTFYIQRYTVFTTHPSQPTYIYTILHSHAIPKSTANVHHFKPTFMCPRSIVGLPLRRQLHVRPIAAHHSPSREGQQCGELAHTKKQTQKYPLTKWELNTK